MDLYVEEISVENLVKEVRNATQPLMLENSNAFDIDIDGTIDRNSVTIITEPAGNIDVNNDGDGFVTLVRKGNNSNPAPQTFTYTVQDNDGDVSNIATVTITVPTTP